MSRPALGVYLAVALGSALGGLARWLAGEAAAALGAGFPWGTLAVNVTGSFAIGLYAARLAPAGRRRATPAERHFVTTGLCGGYTTFSMFTLETLRLAAAGALAPALANVALSLALWLAAAWAGWAAGSRLAR